MFQMNDFQFINYPVFTYNKELYWSYIKLYLKKITKLTKAIYILGNIRYPGISDIDLLIIPIEDKSFLPQRLNIFSRLKNDKYIIRYLFLHQPFIVFEKHKFVISYTYHINKQLIWGDDILSDVIILDNVYNKELLVLEFLLAYKRWLRDIFITKKVNIRYALTVISSFRFTANLIKEIDFEIESKIRDVVINFTSVYEIWLKKIYEEKNFLIDQFYNFICNFQLVIKYLLNSYSIKFNFKSEVPEIVNLLKFGEFRDLIKLRLDYFSSLRKKGFWYGSIFNTALYCPIYKFQKITLKDKVLNRLIELI